MNSSESHREKYGETVNTGFRPASHNRGGGIGYRMPRLDTISVLSVCERRSRLWNLSPSN
ncbi:hypothetical protein JOE21_000789 [Desmospora profundinema]|uniref:Uncharacterized protein n=1 Tax=Desmospora profundinema TaxID=1571184 RepID=A0ABU1IJ72_9BACL|nr:hypothetical protein [Desmospora profundinema]